MVLAASYPLGICAQGIADVVSALSNTACYEAKASFSVSLPQSDKDVIYDLGLMSMATPADTLAPCSYLIDWGLDTPSGRSEGFSAYFDGNLYRYRNNRLQEYHMGWDPMPFRTDRPGGGVQTATQFTDLLPQFMGREIQRMTTDSLYALSFSAGKIFNGQDAVEIRSVMTVGGQVTMERTYTFAAADFTPLRIVTESSPSQLTEQTIIVNYEPNPSPKCLTLSEEAIVERYPEQFEKYRESNFRIENLRDTPLPSFALPTTTGERYLHHRGEKFANPTVIALIDPTVGSFNAEIVKQLRAAVDQSTVPTDVIYAFTTTNPSLPEELIPQIRPGEHMLLNARSLARDCGAASLPVIILADQAGIVKNVILGFNNNIENIVMQSIALM